jgi:hypothetical protein
MLWLVVGAILVVSSLFATGWLHAQARMNWRMAWVPAIGVSAVSLLVHGLSDSATGPAGHRGTPALADVSRFAWPMEESGLARAQAEQLRWSPVGSGTPPETRPAAPVDSLVRGLRTRLEQNPDDAAGWALLAQSYAFLGEADLLQEAMQRAIALGANEATLRQRIEEAAHSSVAAAQRATSLTGSLR